MTKETKQKFTITGGIILALILCAIGIYFLYQDEEYWRTTISHYLEMARGTPWALPFVVAVYVLGGVFMFPIMVLNLACAVVFGIGGIFYALAGCMANALVFFGLGKLVHRKYGRKLLSFPKIHKVDTALNHAGVTGVVAIHIIPVPPFTIVNLAAGLTTISLSTYMLGTFMAMVPGAVARGIVGDSITKIFLSPTAETYMYLVLGLLLWAGLIALTHVTVKKFQPATT